MKVIQGQQHGHYKGLVTVALDGITEANLCAKGVLEKFKLPKDFEDCFRIVRANPNYAAHNAFETGMTKEGFRKDLEKAFHEIEFGHDETNRAAVELAGQLVENARHIEPSLTQEQSYQPHEEGEIFDAGKVATNDPMAFFNKRNTDRIRTGRGDGAFRIVINTDVSWWGDPTIQCANLMALVILLQRESPVEIWVQQGWLTQGSPMDGVTLFRIFSGMALQPQQIYFWVGSKLKDSPYSWAVNRFLGRKGSGCSGTAEIPCDLYIYGQWMPDVSDPAELAKWTAATARQLLFDEELPENWKGFGTAMPPAKSE